MRSTTRTRTVSGTTVALLFGLILALFATTAVVVGAAQAAGATYYVDTENGDDSDSGTSTTGAWKTIGAANAANFEPGDRLLFAGGQTFAGNLRLGAEDAGTAAEPVEVGSYGEGMANISAGSGKGVSVYNAGGVEVSNLTVTGAGRAAGNEASGIEFYTDRGNATKLEHVRVDGVEVSGFGDAGILLGAWPADGTKSGFRDVRITDVVAHDNADAGIESFGYYSVSASGWAHEDVYVGGCRTYDNEGIPDKGGNSGSGVVLGDVNGAIVERCVSHDNGEKNNSGRGGPIGIWAWDSNEVTIQYNESYDNKTGTIDGGGFDLDGGVTNSVLQYNYSHGNAGAGYLVYRYDGARPSRNNTVRYNISENDGRTKLGGIHAGGGVADTEVYNNTVYIGPRASGGMPPAVMADGTSNFHVRNNLFVTTGGAPQVQIPYGQKGLVFQSNAYWSSGDAFAIKQGGKTHTSLGAWRNATGQERNGSEDTGLSVAPGLTDPGGGGAIGDADRLSTLTAYMPRDGSPMIDAGLDLQRLFDLDPGPTDFHGVTTPQGPGGDIGASEVPTAEREPIPNTAPTVSDPRPSPDSSTSDRTPAISATVRDAEADLARSNIALYVDGRLITDHAYDPSTGLLGYTSRRLPLGKHTVRIVATDAEGASEDSVWSFRIAKRR